MADYRRMTPRECMDSTPEDLEPMSAGEVGRLAGMIGHGSVYLLPYELRHQCSLMCGPHLYLDLHRGGAWVARDALSQRLKDWVKFWNGKGVVEGFAMIAFSTGMSQRNLPVIRVYSLRDDYYLAVVDSIGRDFRQAGGVVGKNEAFICDQTRGLLQLVSDIVPNMAGGPDAG